ncbi:MAG: hypothetical protein IKS17_09565 [Firmicutes bacterium]|nr:hypothetical protein [Bacillota bacterium]
MDTLDFIRERFDWGCTAEDVKDLLKTEYGLTDDAAEAEIQYYYDFIESL